MEVKKIFLKKAYLTVSSQLQLEAICSGLGRCYTTNTSFRAEKSSTLHLASFTHIEYELSHFSKELMDISESMVRFVITECLENVKKNTLFEWILF